MTYAVRWSRQAEKFIAKLPVHIAKRIVHRINEAKNKPFHYLEHYEGAEFCKLRIGDYRLLVEVDIRNRILAVRVVGHRRNVYK